MFRNTAVPFSFLILLIIVTSCFSKVTISVLEPGIYTLPSIVKKVTIYAEPGMQVKPGFFDSLTDLQFDPETDINKIRQGYLDGITEIMSVSPRFRKAVLSDTVFDKQLSYGNLTWNAVDKICAHDTSDALLFLGRAVSYSNHDNTYSFSWPADYLALSRILNKTAWMLFSPVTHQQLASYKYNDTVSIAPELLTDPENIGDVLYQNCYVMGKSFGEKLCPHWQDVERIIYFGPGRELRKAMAYTSADNWLDAGDIWDKLAESPNKKKAYRASFNLALAYERDDVLDQAMLWISYADSLHSTAASSAYKKILENRLKLKPSLDEQLAGN
jgi:hypothetical protein